MRPRVKHLVQLYNSGGIENVRLYLNNPNMIIDPSTWCYNIKTKLDEGHNISVEMEISLIIEKFNTYRNV